MLLTELQLILLEKKFKDWIDEQEEKTGMKIHNFKMFQLWFSCILGSDMGRLENYKIPEVNRLVKKWSKTEEAREAKKEQSRYEKRYGMLTTIDEMTSSGAVAGVNQNLFSGLLRRPGVKTAVSTTKNELNRKYNKKAKKKKKLT